MEHHFHFKRGDLELSFSGERDFVEAQVALHLPLMGGPATSPRLSLDVREEPKPETAEAFRRVSPDFKPKRNVTMADFVKLKSAVAPTDLVVVAGYYLEKYMQQETFTPADLQTLLSDVEAWSCQVVDEVLPITLARGYVEQLRGERYTLTYKGQTYVRDGLS